MQAKLGEQRSNKDYSPLILPTVSWWRRVFYWTCAAIFVTFFYVAAAFAVYSMSREPDTLAGAPPALMLVFADEATAPDSPDISDNVQSQTQVNEPEIEEQPEEELEPEPVVSESNLEPVISQPSDMVEEVKEEQLKEKIEKVEVKPTPKLEKPSPKKQAQKAKRNQTASAPFVDAKRGETYAAQRTNQTDGLGGKLFNDWRGKVQIKLRRIAGRLGRQAGGLSGIATVHFSYDASGQVTAVTISRSSGNENVNDIALKVVKMASPIPTPPNGGGSLTVPVQIR